MNPHPETEKGIKLVARVGIHTGLVVAGDMDKAIVGETPSFATHLQNFADPDALIISHATYRLIEGYFDCRELGTYPMKGITRPLPLYQVLYASAAHSRLEAARVTGLTPLVGRAKEIGMLQERWEQVIEGNGQVVLLNGEAGIGKSRLVQELKEHVATNPKAWLTECYCSPYHQSSALHPLIELLERVVLQFEAEESGTEKLRKLEGFLVQYGLGPAGNRTVVCHAAVDSAQRELPSSQSFTAAAKAKNYRSVARRAIDPRQPTAVALCA
jgi:hypothetical protein